jgi:hypothetical protein
MTVPRILPTRPAAPTWAPPAALVAAWLVAAVLGWLLFLLLGGPALTGAGRTAVFAGCLLVALALAAAGTRLLAGSPLAVPDAGWAAVLALGWGAANAAGWTLAVEVGGPLIGLATGVALAGAASGISVRRGVAVGAVGLVAVLLARLVAADLPPVLGLLVSVVAAVVGVALARWALVPALPLVPVVVLVAANGVAWVGAWLLAEALISPIAVSVSIAVEILLAVALSAALLGWMQDEPVGRTTGRWTLCALGGLAVAVLLAALAGAVLPSEDLGDRLGGVVGFLDLGTTVGLALAAWFAGRPALGRPLRWSNR